VNPVLSNPFQLAVRVVIVISLVSAAILLFYRTQRTDLADSQAGQDERNRFDLVDRVCHNDVPASAAHFEIARLNEARFA
jgi:hypothetical protein